MSPPEFVCFQNKGAQEFHTSKDGYGVHEGDRDRDSPPTVQVGVVLAQQVLAFGLLGDLVNIWHVKLMDRKA